MHHLFYASLLFSLFFICCGNSHKSEQPKQANKATNAKVSKPKSTNKSTKEKTQVKPKVLPAVVKKETKPKKEKEIKKEPEAKKEAKPKKEAKKSEEKSIPVAKVQKLAIPQNDQIYFGAYASFGDDENNVTKENIEEFETLAKKKVTWVYFTNSWKEGITYPRETIQRISKLGKVPFVRFLPRRTDKEDQENLSMITQDIIDGKFDKALKAWANEAKKDNIPLLMDFGLEMTGWWMSWSGKWQGGGKTDAYGDPSYPDGPERFRDAYRHIITLFRNEGVHHITWFFHPDIQRMPDVEWNSAKYYYPGDDYIDWIGLSVYGVQFVDERWKTFSKSLDEGATFIKEISDKKPIALLEVGITDGREDGSKAKWFKETFKDILSNPYLKFSAFVYWDEDWENEDGSFTHLKIDSSPESLDAFQKGIENPRFISKSIFTQ